MHMRTKYTNLSLQINKHNESNGKACVSGYEQGNEADTNHVICKRK